MSRLTHSRPAKAHQCVAAGGFTLIELIVTIAVIGILAAIAVPSLTDYLSNQRVKGAAENLYAAMQNAKFEAAKTNQTLSLQFQPDTVSTTHTSWCYGMTTTTSTTCNCSTGSPACADGSVVSSTSYPDVTVSFTNSNTRSFTALRSESNSTDGVVTFGTGSKTLGVRLTAFGRVSLCRPTGTTISGDTDSTACP